MARGDLVGRDAELATLLRAADEALRGDGATVLVAGDPGIGKSYLLGTVRDRLEQLGFRVLTGRASEYEALPSGLFVDALDDHLRTLDRPPLRSLGPDALARLSGVFPSLGDLAGPAGATAAPGAGADERVGAYAAVRTLLAHLAREEPLALVLDDLHWADRSSVELFTFLVRRPPPGRLLLVGSYRPHQVDAELAAEVTRATHDGRARLVEMGPLDATEAAALVGTDDPRLADDLVRRTGGNPFYLLALTAARERQGTLARGASGSGLPPAIARAVLAELDRAGAAREFANAAAVVGDPFDLDLATAAAGLDDDAGYRAVDELAARRIIQAGDLPRQFAFRHPLVRQAVYDALPPGQRLVLHERCATALVDRGAAAPELAHHVEHAARPGDLDAVEVLTTAARQVAALAPDLAARWLQTARRLLPRTAPTAQRLELVRALPPLLAALGEPDAAHAASAEAVDLADDAHERTVLVLECVLIEQALGRYEDAHHRLTDLLREVGTQGEDAVAVMVAMVFDAFYHRDSEAVVSWTQRAVDEATRVGVPVLEAAAHAAAAFTHALAGVTDVAERHVDAAVAILPTLTDEELARRLDVLSGITGAELYLDRYDACVEHGARGLAVGRASGRLWTAPSIPPAYGCALWVLGRLEESIAFFDASTEAARAARNPQQLAWALFNLAFAQAMGGRLDEALAASRESSALAERHDDSVLGSWAGAVRALAELESGDPAAALRTLYGACGGPELPGIPGGWRNNLFEVAARSHLALGQPAEAERSRELARAWADAVRLPYARSLSHRIAAHCLAARGEHDEAAREGLLSVEQAEAAAAHFDAARSRIVAGRALVDAGRPEDAVAHLSAAAEFLDACGSHRFRDEAERELGRAGRRPHRRTARGSAVAGAAALTAREREIAGLVAERLTNPEIAARMYLSPKTVETHLSNVFRKLGVASRTEVARALSR